MRTNHGKKGNERTSGDQNEAEEEGKRGRLGDGVEFEVTSSSSDDAAVEIGGSCTTAGAFEPRYVVGVVLFTRPVVCDLLCDSADRMRPSFLIEGI